MNDQASRVSALITRFLNNDLDEEGKKELAEWKDQDEDNRRLFEKMTNEELLFNAVRERYASEVDIYNRVQQNVPELSEEASGKIVRMKRFSWRKMTAAAAVVLIIATLYYFGLYNSKPKTDKQEEIVATIQNDATPGKTKAVLTLSDGSKIVLDSATKGKLTQQGNTIVLNEDGQLVYDASSASPEGEAGMRYNSLTTANGETYSTILADGSKVWLNSASSINFPVAFTGGQRKVEITGDVYF